MASTGPPADPGRELLDELDDLPGAVATRMRLELLNHLVAVALARGEPLPDELWSVAARFGVPGAARLLVRLIETVPEDRRPQEARRWLAGASDFGEAATATLVAAVAPHLAAQEGAYIAAMGLTSEPLWVAALLALGRIDEARASARGELLARVRVVSDGPRVARPAGSPDDPWWRVVAILRSAAGSPPGGGQGPDRGDAPGDGPVRADAVPALVGIGDGAWHLAAVRLDALLGSSIAEADISGGAFLASAGTHLAPSRIERAGSLLERLDPVQRRSTIRALIETLVGGTGAQPTIAVPPPRSPEAAEAPGAPPRSFGRRGLVGRLRRRSVTSPQPSAPASSGPGGSSRAADDRGPGTVSTGFATLDDPPITLDARRPLRPGQAYAFWLEVGPEALPGSIETDHVPLPADLSAGARLTVAVFAYDGELRLRTGATTGVLELVEGGTAVVVRQPEAASSRDGDRRLRFAVTAPEALGAARLRCSIYHRGVLVQSRVITAVVGGPPAAADEPNALRSEVDYRLLTALGAASLGRLSEHRASLLLNDDGAGTHGLRFAATDGGDVLTRDVSIGEGAIGDRIRMARSALRRVAWGSDQEWSEGLTYRYGGPADEERLTADLVALAANGARFFQLLTEEVAASDPDGSGAPDPYLARDRIAEVLRRPGRIQIALQRAPNHILPAALIYDHWLTDSAPSEAYRLCPDFAEVYRSGGPLEGSSCFLGGCPQAHHGAELTVVCPSGFWGFRHELGFPVSQGEGADATELISVEGGPAVSVAVSTELTSAPIHAEGLRGIDTDGARWRLADTRDEVLAGLRSDDQQVFYLYCHGGVTNNVPYVLLGETGARPITRLDLANERVRWAATRPLVILNGCHTTALDPETAIDFVRFFVGTALASGVVGTEITVFEELGQAFGQAFMERFLVPGTTIGSAIRGARLDLLQTGNPLGLVYIPFALAGLRLAAVPSGG